MAPPCLPFTEPAARLLGAAATLAASLVTTDAAHAGPLADPTRPPAALAAPGGLAAAALPQRANLDTARTNAANAANASAAAAATARATLPPPPPAALPQLQSVQLRAQGKALALVDGRLVQVGDLLEGRAVLAIDSQGLLLQGPRGPERLWLLAGTPKQAAGSITHSKSARFEAASTPGAAGNTTTGNPAAQLPERGQAAATPPITSAATGSLSQAGRTAP